jgi:putative flavoprotein involved in K+ transport
MDNSYNTIVIGGGQAGLVTSFLLKKNKINHIVLEQSKTPAYSWREQKWDSFCFVIPNWTLDFSGGSYKDLNLNPDDFIVKKDIISFFEHYIKKNDIPIEFSTKVIEITKLDNNWVIQTTKGSFNCENVIIATGFFHNVKIPQFASKISKNILQLDTTTYKNPNQVKEGAILVVGSGQSGMQIAEELIDAKKKKFSYL